MARRPLELLRRPARFGYEQVKVATGAKAWCGRTTLGSGSSSVTVSTAMVTSDCIWRGPNEISPGSAGVLIGSGAMHVVINSVVQGVSFAIARACGVGAPWSSSISWEIVRVS